MDAGGLGLEIQVPASGSPYDYRTFEALAGIGGVRELRIGLKGSVRLARIDVVPGKESA